MDIHHLPAYELANKIKNKEISSLELTQHFIDRIEKYDDKINAVVVRTFDDAIEAAKKSRRSHFEARFFRSTAWHTDDYKRVLQYTRSMYKLGYT